MKRGSTRTASWAEVIRVAAVGDQRGVMLSGIGLGGTAGMGGARNTSARRGERDMVVLAHGWYGCWEVDILLVSSVSLCLFIGDFSRFLKGWYEEGSMSFFIPSSAQNGGRADRNW